MQATPQDITIYYRAIDLWECKVGADQCPAMLYKLFSATRPPLQYFLNNGITRVLMMDKTKGQRIQYAPGAIPPAGLVMDGYNQYYKNSMYLIVVL